MIPLAQQLLAHQSVTPVNDGVLETISAYLTALGFTCRRLRFAGQNTHATDNLYARLGTTAPHICFAGHTDVVPVGRTPWTHPPFAGIIDNGILYGRGIADMKGAIAAFMDAVQRLLSAQPITGSISFLITNDEEGPAHNGTHKVLQWLEQQHEHIDLCVVGEPTNPQHIGTTIKHGRRGSVTFALTVTGTQGHVAYPALARNAAHDLITLLHACKDIVLDNGTADFDPSHLEIVSIGANDGASNVIPGTANAVFNVRFNNARPTHDLVQHIEHTIASAAHTAGVRYTLTHNVSAEPFLTNVAGNAHVQQLQQAIMAHTPYTPEFSTTGGTSDARFISRYYPVVEFGGINATAHHTNEHMCVDDLITLRNVYADFLRRVFVGG